MALATAQSFAEEVGYVEAGILRIVARLRAQIVEVQVADRETDVAFGERRVDEVAQAAPVRLPRADSTVPEIPVIFLTSVEEGEHRGKSFGVVGYITKPVRADKLLALVAQHMSAGRLPIG